MKLTAVAFLLFASRNVGAPRDSLFRRGVVIALPNKPSNVALADLNKTAGVRIKEERDPTVTLVLTTQDSLASRLIVTNIRVNLPVLGH